MQKKEISLFWPRVVSTTQQGWDAAGGGAARYARGGAGEDPGKLVLSAHSAARQRLYLLQLVNKTWGQNVFDAEEEIAQG